MEAHDDDVTQQRFREMASGHVSMAHVRRELIREATRNMMMARATPAAGVHRAVVDIIRTRQNPRKKLEVERSRNDVLARAIAPTASGDIALTMAPPSCLRSASPPLPLANAPDPIAASISRGAAGASKGLLYQPPQHSAYQLVKSDSEVPPPFFLTTPQQRHAFSQLLHVVESTSLATTTNSAGAGDSPAGKRAPSVSRVRRHGSRSGVATPSPTAGATSRPLSAGGSAFATAAMLQYMGQHLHAVVKYLAALRAEAAAADPREVARFRPHRHLIPLSPLAPILMSPGEEDAARAEHKSRDVTVPWRGSMPHGGIGCLSALLYPVRREAALVGSSSRAGTSTPTPSPQTPLLLQAKPMGSGNGSGVATPPPASGATTRPTSASGGLGIRLPCRIGTSNGEWQAPSYRPPPLPLVTLDDFAAEVIAAGASADTLTGCGLSPIRSPVEMGAAADAGVLISTVKSVLWRFNLTADAAHSAVVTPSPAASTVDAVTEMVADFFARHTARKTAALDSRRQSHGQATTLGATLEQLEARHSISGATASISVSTIPELRPADAVNRNGGSTTTAPGASVTPLTRTDLDGNSVAAERQFEFCQELVNDARAVLDRIIGRHEVEDFDLLEAEYGAACAVQEDAPASRVDCYLAGAPQRSLPAPPRVRLLSAAELDALIEPADAFEGRVREERYEASLQSAGPSGPLGDALRRLPPSFLLGPEVRLLLEACCVADPAADRDALRHTVAAATSERNAEARIRSPLGGRIQRPGNHRPSFNDDGRVCAHGHRALTDEKRFAARPVEATCLVCRGARDDGALPLSATVTGAPHFAPDSEVLSADPRVAMQQRYTQARDSLTRWRARHHLAKAQGELNLRRLLQEREAASQHVLERGLGHVARATEDRAAAWTLLRLQQQPRPRLESRRSIASAGIALPPMEGGGPSFSPAGVSLASPPSRSHSPSEGRRFSSGRESPLGKATSANANTEAVGDAVVANIWQPDDAALRRREDREYNSRVLWGRVVTFLFLVSWPPPPRLTRLLTELHTQFTGFPTASRSALLRWLNACGAEAFIHRDERFFARFVQEELGVSDRALHAWLRLPEQRRANWNLSVVDVV